MREHERNTHKSSLPSRVAALVHAHFDALPTRCKPNTRQDGSREWIPMTGIVLVRGQDTLSETLTCVTVTTGAKCHPSSQIPRCRGLVLHDCHAEILALRAFNNWILNECMAIIQSDKRREGSISQEERLSSAKNTFPFIRRRGSLRSSVDPWPAFEICPDIKIYMYCTCAPCGDASMELCMASQEDATPWDVESHLQTDKEDPTQLLDGRAHFSILGVVRRKPSRADAESTLSKSCSDKLGLRQVTSLLSYPVSLLVAPAENAYLAGLIMPEEEINRVACDRAFGAGLTGRMWELAGRSWLDEGYGYQFRPFEVLAVPTRTVEALWPYRKPKTDSSASSKDRKKNKTKPGNISAVWIATPSPRSLFQLRSCETTCHGLRISVPSPATGVIETIINGVKQGNIAASITARGASVLSRAKMWNLLCDIMESLSDDDTANDNQRDGSFVPQQNRNSIVSHLHRGITEAQTYEQFKRPSEIQSSRLTRLRTSAMQDAKRVLRPWIPNRGDEAWNRTEVLVDPKRMNFLKIEL